MGFRVEIDPIKESDIAKLTTGNELLAQILADYANARAKEAQKQNQAIIAGGLSTFQNYVLTPSINYAQSQWASIGPESNFFESISARVGNIEIPYTSTVNGKPKAVTADAIMVEFTQKTIEIEYTFDFGLSVAASVARMLARRLIRRAIIGGIGKLFGGDEDKDRPSVLRYIMDALQENSPHLTGTYSESFKLTGDGQEIAPEEATEDMHEFVFVNTTAYARKIEAGLSQQTPDGVFEGVAAIASHEFGDVADIAFVWREPPPEVETRLNRTPSITVVFR